MMHTGVSHFQKNPPGDNALAWEACDYVNDKVAGHNQSLPHLLRILKDMQKTLDRTRVAYNQVLQDRDDERAKLQEAENRLGSVQRVVQRYAGVQEPVVASDGYTYERSVIQQYLSECKSTETNAYSQQTKEVLTNNLVPNESLKKLVDLLRQVRPTDIAPASKASSIPPYRATAAPAEDEKKRTITANDLEAGLTSKAEASATASSTEQSSTAGAQASKPSAPKKDREEVRPSTTRGATKPEALHPCLRVYGRCNFEDDCSFAKYPYDACLNYIKGKCRFGDGCKELHVNLRDGKYINANATNNQQHRPAGPARQTTDAAAPKKAAEPAKTDDKKSVASALAGKTTAAPAKK